MAELKSITFPIKIGGYYAYKDNDVYKIFRLLDINKDSYHSQYFQETFDHQPSFEEVKDLRPYMLHAPIGTASLLYEPSTLIGQAPLDPTALQGYNEYQRQMDISEADIQQLQDKLIAWSQPNSNILEVTITSDGEHDVVIKMPGSN